VIGKFHATVEIEGCSVEADFSVFQGKGRSLLSKCTAESLGVLKVSLNVNATRSPTARIASLLCCGVIHFVALWGEEMVQFFRDQ
jgi:hypothetical protein